MDNRRLNASEDAMAAITATPANFMTAASVQSPAKSTGISLGIYHQGACEEESTPLLVHKDFDVIANHHEENDLHVKKNLHVVKRI